MGKNQWMKPENYLKGHKGESTGDTYPHKRDLRTDKEIQPKDYLERHKGETTGDTSVDYKSSNVRAGITNSEVERYALQLRKYELIDEIIRIAKRSGKEIDEEALRNELNSKSIQELKNALEKLENQQSKQEPSTNQQETKTTGEGREPGE